MIDDFLEGELPCNGQIPPDLSDRATTERIANLAALRELHGHLRNIAQEEWADAVKWAVREVMANEQLTYLRLQPEDILVLTVDPLVCRHEETVATRKRIEEPTGHAVCLLRSGMKLEVLRPAVARFTAKEVEWNAMQESPPCGSD